MPELSVHFQGRQPSPIRHAQILFGKRPDADEVTCINLAIGNVSLPMHPAMRERLQALDSAGSPFDGGVCRYTHSAGTEESRAAFLHLIASCGADVSQLGCVVTDGGSMAMELMVLGTCGPGSKRPLMLLEPAYANYADMASRACVPVTCVRRHLEPSGRFGVQDLAVLDEAMRREKPRALVIIPADNPTGSYLSQAEIAEIAALCVEHDAWLVSDEAYRQLHYNGEECSSVWRLTEADVPGISGRRISIESASKVWNACGLRVGALVTDDDAFLAKALCESTANLCSNAIGQHVFGALAHVPHEELEGWYGRQREYYQQLMGDTVAAMRREVPGLVVSNPDASLYSVLDLREMAPGFDAARFVTFCAESARVDVGGEPHTLLLAPMDGFYREPSTTDGPDPAKTQMRLAYVEPPEQMEKVPALLGALLREYLG